MMGSNKSDVSPITMYHVKSCKNGLSLHYWSRIKMYNKKGKKKKATHHFCACSTHLSTRLKLYPRFMNLGYHAY